MPVLLHSLREVCRDLQRIGGQRTYVPLTRPSCEATPLGVVVLPGVLGHLVSQHGCQVRPVVLGQAVVSLMSDCLKRRGKQPVRFDAIALADGSCVVGMLSRKSAFTSVVCLFSHHNRCRHFLPTSLFGAVDVRRTRALIPQLGSSQYDPPDTTTTARKCAGDSHGRNR